MRSAKGIHICTVAATLLAMVLASCTKGEIIDMDVETEIEISTDTISIADVALTAVINNDSTKTSIGPAGADETKCNVVWSKEDAIAVINNGKLYRFKIADNGENTGKGSFVIDKNSMPPGYTEGDFNIEMPIQAFYPYEGVVYDQYSKEITYRIPQEQTNILCTLPSGEKKKSFGQGLMPMAGYASNAKEEIRFRKLFGALKFTISGADGEYIESIEILSDTKVNGNALVTIEEGYGNTPDISINIYQNQENNGDNAEYNKIVFNFANSTEEICEPVEYLATLPVKASNIGILVNTSIASYYKAVPERYINEKEADPIIAGEIYTVPEIRTTQMPPAYIENGIYLGDGIELPETADGTRTIIWAPVNCGYESEVKDGGFIAYRGYQYGKLYQWGRKEGQGYKDNVYEDATFPYETTSFGGGTPETDKFYHNWAVQAKEWPVESDPCPEGWRVPTSEELVSLVNGLQQNDFVTGLESQWTASNNNTGNRHYGLPGFWFYGSTEDGEEKAFFPATGFYRYDLQGTQIRGMSGCYWSSTAHENGTAWYMDFNRRGYIDTYFDNQACGRSIRCIKITD